MSNLLYALLLGGYIFLILPAIFLILAAFLDHTQNPEQPSRRRLLVFLSLTALVLVLLELLIWFNPYGREINSSIPAFGVLIVLVALLAYLLHHSRGLVQLWSTDKTLIIIFALIYPALFNFLWFTEHATFYLLIVLAPAIALAWYVARAGLALLGMLSVLTLLALVFISGGTFFIPTADQLAWLQTTFQIITVVALLLSILLPAGLLFSNLRASPPLKRSRLLWSLILSVVLLAGAAYQMAWEGVWSAAHARAFEDHLPFAHFMLSLVAGVFLALTLRGTRRLVAPLYIILVTGVTTLAFTWGWNISAFDMTERRAMTVNKAIVSYYQENGSYPASLTELSPRYLLFLPPPAVVRLGGWCYQSGQDYYRLGYISGLFTYFDAIFQVVTYSQVGDLPLDTWACDDLLVRFQAMEFTY